MKAAGIQKIATSILTSSHPCFLYLNKIPFERHLECCNTQEWCQTGLGVLGPKLEPSWGNEATSFMSSLL